MPDCHELVDQRLVPQRSGADIEPEVAEALAHYLEDFYEAGLENRLTENEAAERALAEVPLLAAPVCAPCLKKKAA